MPIVGGKRVKCPVGYVALLIRSTGDCMLLIDTEPYCVGHTLPC